LPALRGRCLRLPLLTGGQRIEQLVRLRWADVRADSITLYDIKGRPGQGARTHTVPIGRFVMTGFRGRASARACHQS
jgi:integrase